MKSLWDDAEAARFEGPLGHRVYSSRLLGREPALVLHGGGNTSVKRIERDVLGREHRILWVKGSGCDLETIDEAGFSPVRLDHLVELSKLPSLSDPDMVSELRANMTRASARTPSVEAILHAILPFPYVDHTHADAVVALTNTADGEARAREIYGADAILVPYVMPGFDLARACAEIFAREATPRTRGMILLSHGVFSFGESARESYERMIELVSRAEAALPTVAIEDAPAPAPCRRERAELRAAIAKVAGFPVILRTDDRPRGRAFARHPRARELAARGPATPDHVIRTKRAPLVGRDVEAFAAEYRAYFDRNAPGAREPKRMLDPAPRVVLDPELGMLTAGASVKDARTAADIYDRTAHVIACAEALGGWKPLGEREIFDMEYWDLEQQKLRAPGKKPMFTGEIALVTGAASGIGAACVDALLARGAAVVGLDLRACERDREDFLGLRCDVTDLEEVRAAIDRAVLSFGGVDMLIACAGVFPAAAPIAELADAEWERVLAVNVSSARGLLRELHPLLARAPAGGRVVVIGSKNVEAPGKGAAAYSASKAALTQLARVAALEWGKDKIRVNVLHPDAVFDTGIWTPEVLASRAAQYGLDVGAYKTRNVLGVEIASRDVAELAAEMCGPLFAKTTGAQIPVDGGNERVI